jgi:ATP-dependent helicase/nuclease subunit A
VGVAAAVRLLTVHGAKGLEAPVVLLLDTDAGPPRPETMGVLVDWPGEQATPRRFSFLASETRPPGCHTAAMAEELAARQREELNALYVAMTRAQRELVVSSVEPRSAAATPSWWQRLEPLCQPAEVPADARDGATPAVHAPVMLSVVPAGPARRPDEATVSRNERTPASRFGELVHRLLELQGAGGLPDGVALVRLGRSFGVQPQEQQAALAMAHRIAAGEGAWLWNPVHVVWQADEVELTDRGEVLRLDRLVRRRDGTWWVVDYKSASRPERDAALQAQLRRYAAAVARLNPGAGVRAAFLTGEGRLVPID